MLEVGVGGGAVTKNIEGLGGFYLGIDVNKNLIDRAKKTFPQLSFAVADARYLSGTIKEPVDIIVSSLGLRAMPAKMVADIFNEFNRVLSPSGRIVQYTYGPRDPVPKDTQEKLRFSSSSRGWTLRNIPPVQVFLYEKI